LDKSGKNKKNSNSFKESDEPRVKNKENEIEKTIIETVNGQSLKQMQIKEDDNYQKKAYNDEIILFKSREIGVECPESQTGEHIFINNICMCGKVTDIILEDEEEYDDEGNVCPKSKTGNHHFKNGEQNCFYCNAQKNPRMTIVKSIRKANREDLSILNNNPFILDAQECVQSSLAATKKINKKVRFSKDIADEIKDLNVDNIDKSNQNSNRK
jgi:hypothetical protein